MLFDTGSISSLFAGGVVAAVAVIAYRFISHRRAYQNLPGPPHSLLWGHMKILGEYIRKLPSKTYPMHAALTQMKLDFDLPDLWYLDLWPVGPRFLICNAPDAAAIPTTNNPFPQSHVVTKFFAGNTGTSFIEATNGQLWKDLHQMLAPGLTPAATRMYYDLIAEEAETFHGRLRKFVETGETIDLNEELGKFPFEVISRIFFGERLNSQTTDPELYDDTKGLADVIGFLGETSQSPFAKWDLQRRKRRIVESMDRQIERRVRDRFLALQETKVLPNRTNATNLLDRMLVSQVQSGQPLDASTMVPIIENAKGLLAAGYGTTTDTSSYIYMLLSVYPEVLSKLREEHERLFGKTTRETLRTLRENPGSIKDLEYTTAVVQETLRAFPIGMICRDPPPGIDTLEYKGTKYPVKDHVLGVTAQSMHYNPNVFTEPKKFDPDRFLGDNATYPRSGYRPFERGLRSCMGQNLAMDEMRILLLMTVRWFDFELLDHEPAEEPRMSFTDFDTKLGIHAFQYQKFSAGPHGPVSMKVRLARR